jgi:hypothetical protein
MVIATNFDNKYIGNKFGNILGYFSQTHPVTLNMSRRGLFFVPASGIVRVAAFSFDGLFRNKFFAAIFFALFSIAQKIASPHQAVQQLL